MKVSCGICKYLFSQCALSVAVSSGVAAVFFEVLPAFYAMFKDFYGPEPPWLTYLPWLTRFVLSNYQFILLLPLAAVLLCSVDRLRKETFLPSAARARKIAWIILWILIGLAIPLCFWAMYLPIFNICCVV